MIAHLASKFGAGIAAVAVLGGICSSSLPALAHTAPAVVADASSTSGSCGAITIGASGSDAATIHSATSCLQQAFSSCTPSQLAVTWDLATERVDRVLTVSPADSGCQIVDQVTHTEKSSGQDSMDVYTCSDLTSGPNGVTIRKCGVDGDIQVPAAN